MNPILFYIHVVLDHSRHTGGAINAELSDPAERQ
jgi:hypothetical protein